MATPDQEIVSDIENKAGFTGDALKAAKTITDVGRLGSGNNLLPDPFI